MTDKQPDFSGRRHRIFERLGSDVLVLVASPKQYKSGDTSYEYRAASDLLYVAGVDDPGAVLILCGPAEEERSILFLPEASETAALWDGARTAPEDAVERYGVDAAYGIAELERRLPELLGLADRIFHRWGVSDGVDRAVRGAVASGVQSRRRTGRGPVGVLESSLLIDELRIQKDANEIESIRAACDLTLRGHEAGWAAVAPGVGEWVIEAQIEATFRSGGAFGPAFSTIVGSGANACVLHYTQNDRVLQDGELVLMDAGAELGYYAGDVTRTVPVSGNFSAEQRALYEVVEEARAAAVAACAPGISIDAPHAAAVAVVAEGLVALKVLQGTSADEVLETGAYAPFMPHKTSHWLGLDVHDVGDYVVDGAPRILEPGMVLTVEPGLYFPPSAEAVPEAFRGVGIRIEDDVLITTSGHDNLTAALPTAPEALLEHLAQLRAERAAGGKP